MPTSLPIPVQLKGILSTVSLLDIVDIFIVAIILYKLYEMLQDTRAITLVKGLLVLLGLTMVCSWLELHVIYWLLQKTVTLLFVALPIVFQPELRRTLEHLGQGRFFGRSVLLNDEEVRSLVDELDRAVMLLSARKIGALLVLEAELTPPRTALLAMLLRQLPVVVSAIPPGGADQPWPIELRPFAHA